ncbi:MAG: thiamine diphosphokinase [Clostridia bacterium]|nr:thiamine diphosphokinase [Clostridia bacterium]
MNIKFPFEAAIFDLDGTLLDSMRVWQDVDRIFFEKRGMECPEDYGRALSGKSYRESAEYTIERFGLSENWEEIVREWTEQVVEEYSHHVQLNPGARSYLKTLKATGVKLAVATALPEYLYRPCLTNLGILHWFDALCSTDETGGRGKARGEVFLLAANRLGVAPEKCAVFEDVLEGIQGAKCAGMAAYCKKDIHAAFAHAQIETIADGMIDSFEDLLPQRRCVIFTAYCEGDPQAAYIPRENDMILCADAGLETARRAGAKPDAVIGDFDSMDAPQGENIIRHPVIKDDTDTMLCVKYAWEFGIRDFLIIGGIGGRLDHTLANLQTLNCLALRGDHAELCDGRVHIAAVKDGSVKMPRSKGKLSVFALCGKCEGVSIRGAKYELENGTIEPHFPLGMGNDFAADFAEIGVKSGVLLAIREL